MPQFPQAFLASSRCLCESNGDMAVPPPGCLGPRSAPEGEVGRRREGGQSWASSRLPSWAGLSEGQSAGSQIFRGPVPRIPSLWTCRKLEPRAERGGCAGAGGCLRRAQGPYSIGALPGGFLSGSTWVPPGPQ